MSEEETDEGIEVSSRLVTLLFLGLSLVFVGVAVIVVTSIAMGGLGSFGGVVMIGPIPIVFGSGPDAAWLIGLSVTLTIISLVLFYVFSRRPRRTTS
ncbi:MAG: DUF131 domain-containing protein [Candidatus Bathyarchaeota archaeon]|nr:DUF131 domain-containing protein [Candidatus Bathyarchaeota archaeon]